MMTLNRVKRVSSRLGVLASVAALAAGTVACANSREGAASASIMAPSAIDGSAPVTTAAKGGGGGKPGGGGTTTGGGSLQVALYTDTYPTGGNGLINWGDTITYNISQTATTQPLVSTLCYQNSKLVYSAQGYFYDLNNPFPWTKYPVLSSPSWTGGAANCTATLNYINTATGARVNLASTSFNVGA